MISIYKIKPKFQQLLLPILKKLHEAKVTANMITWGAILLSLLTGIFCWIQPYGIAFIILPISLLLRMVLNALDGMMARNYDMQSPKGEMLNELGDVISDFVMFFPLIKLFSINNYILIAFLFLSIVNEFAGLLGKIVSGTRRYDGPMGKSDRALIIGVLSLIFYFTNYLSIYINYIFIVIILSLTISTYFRIHNSLKSL